MCDECDEMEERFYITEQEFRLLLAGKGLTGWYGFDTGKGSQFYTKKEIYEVLVSLYHKQYINWENERVQICEPIASIITVLQRADYCITVQTKHNLFFYQSCYIDKDRVVQIEVSQKEKQMLILHLTSVAEWFRYLKEIESLQSEEQWMEEEREIPIMSILQENIDITFILINMQNGVQESRLEIGEAGLRRYVIYQVKKQRQIFAYQQEWCLNRISEWVNGGCAK